MTRVAGPPLMRKIRIDITMLANKTVRPTRNCDHLSCFCVGTFPPPAFSGDTTFFQPSQRDQIECWYAEVRQCVDYLHDIRCAAGGQPRAARQVKVSSRAIRNAAPPLARAALSPNWIATTMASTDPSTLEAAFIAHAHSMALVLPAFRDVARRVSPAICRKPVGKGMPMANPSGTSRIPLTTSLAESRHAMSVARACRSAKTYTSNSTPTAASARRRRWVLHSRRWEDALPAPLASSMRKTTT